MCETKKCIKCGEEKSITEFRIRKSNNSIRNTCILCERAYNSKHYKNTHNISIKHTMLKKLRDYRKADIKKGYSNNLTIAYALECIKYGCVYCKEPNELDLGLDRIDNKKGHTDDNTVCACYECNTARNDHFTQEEMMVVGESIRTVKVNRKYTEIFEMLNNINSNMGDIAWS